MLFAEHKPCWGHINALLAKNVLKHIAFIFNLLVLKFKNYEKKICFLVTSAKKKTGSPLKKKTKGTNM